jgi:hypothetical protein
MNTDNEELANMLTALSQGELPELRQAILEEAARRWSHKPGQGYSEEAQRIKMIKAELKRFNRLNPKCKVAYEADSDSIVSPDNAFVSDVLRK